MDEEQVDRFAAAIQAQGLILQGIAAMVLQDVPNPPAAARGLKALVGDKFADAPTTPSWVPLERQAKLNHYAAHYAEAFWERVAAGLERQ